MLRRGLFCLVVLVLPPLALGYDDSIALQPQGTTTGGCEYDEIQLASDGTIEQSSLELGERVKPNTTMNATVSAEEYHYYHLCIVRHAHEHQININLTMDEGDANLYLSSLEKYPRMGHSTWISQKLGDDRVKLYTYLDGFPRKAETQIRSLSLHIGVYGIDERSSYNLSVSVVDLPITRDIQSREEFYTQRQHYDEEHFPTYASPGRKLRG
ncbi:hypothetical protein Poli38472_002285 [Pythium oligandrum]|uniref:Secreted protein n=1 Tax=Pythium oligandrum TaxID=41045 RepID=A0A8K1FJP2_PYTOL|nr:hypothetical protein Poli38472_002285 [Pythium oligandrum]|eukprot:TMW63344.1 hypothetical protein Poli38472_002285 [Pythium oligandrum]